MNSEWKIETKSRPVRLRARKRRSRGFCRWFRAPPSNTTTPRVWPISLISRAMDFFIRGWPIRPLRPSSARWPRWREAWPAVAVSAGQTANAFAIINIARSGDHVVAVSSLYGGTVSLLTNTLHKMGIEVSYVSPEADEETIRRRSGPTRKRSSPRRWPILR